MTSTASRVLFWAPLTLGLALALLWLFRPVPVAVDLARAERGPLIDSIEDEGQARVRDMYVVSAPIPGRMRRISLEAGDAVIADETVIAQIEPSDPAFLDSRSAAEARAAVDAAAASRVHAAAQVRRAQAELQFAESELARVRILAQSHTVSENELDAAERRARTADAALGEARAEQKVRESEYQVARARLLTPAARTRAADCDCVTVFSPVSGEVLRVVTESEGVVQSGTPLLEVGNPETLEVVVDLLSSDAVRVHPGQRAIIEAWGGPRPLEGEVRRVEPYGFTKVSALGIEEQRVNVMIDIKSPRQEWARLGHGYRVEPRIVLWESQDVLKVPLGALFRHGGKWSVFIAQDGRAELRTVEIGHENGLEAEILAGLEADEQVVLHPGERVSPGVRLRPRGNDG
jgi:HlyD family secretion protein